MQYKQYMQNVKEKTLMAMGYTQSACVTISLTPTSLTQNC
jgi:hypothetical protein